MTQVTDVAIVGAGPYGLSIATYLRARGVSFRIFGRPMYSWRQQMPEGMLLKSEGFASSLYDPAGSLTLKRFCAEMGLPYADIGIPVPLSTVVDYGLAFQQRMVPELEEKMVTALCLSDGRFRLRLSDGEISVALRVVVATGMSYFRNVPPSLAHLPRELVSHSADHRDLRRFKGRDVTVVGGGSSALDLAAALHDCGADVRLVARRSSIRFNPYAEADRSLWKRIRYPVSGIGFGLRSRFYTDAPILFHYLPEATRLRIVRTYLGPSGGHYLRDRIIGRVPLMLGLALDRAEACGGGVRVCLLHKSGAVHDLTTDHVIAATGYRVDLGRMTFISEDLRQKLRSVEHTPILSANFESSVPGLHFVGLTSANSFGPMMRFMFGAGYTSRRLAKHLAHEPGRNF
jgi:thioredoxin reductase